MARQVGTVRLLSSTRLAAEHSAGTAAEATQAKPKQAIAHAAISGVQNGCLQNEAVSADAGALPIVGWTLFLDLALVRSTL